MSTVAPFDPEGETSEATSIKYIAATSSDARIVGMHLLGDEGVTHAVWEESEDGEDDQEPDEEEDGYTNVEKPKKAVTVHIANVLRDDRVKFLRDLPQLGSFAAVPVCYDSCMHDHAIGDEVVPEEEEEKMEEDESKDDTSEKNEDAGVDNAEVEASEGEVGDEEAEGKESKEELVKAKEYVKVFERVNLVLAVDNISVTKRITTETGTLGYREEQIALLHRVAEALASGLARVEAARFASECALRDSMQEEAVAILESIQEKADERAEALANFEKPESALEEQNAFTEKKLQLDHSSEDVMSFAAHIASISSMQMRPKDSVVKVLAAVAMLTGTELASFTDVRSNAILWPILRTCFSEQSAEALSNLEVMCGNPHGLLRRVLESVDHAEVAGAMACAGALRTWASAYLDACEASQAKQEAEEQKRKEEAEAAAAAAETEAEAKEQEGDDE